MLRNIIVLGLILTAIVMSGCSLLPPDCDGHKLWDTWPAEDGCNICSCTETGIGCTEMACLEGGKCFEAADCETQDLIHIRCVGHWECISDKCEWVCKMEDAKLCSNENYKTRTALSYTGKKIVLTFEDELKLVSEVKEKGNEALREIEDLTCLESLYLGEESAPITDLNSIGKLINLRELLIKSQTLKDISKIANLKKLTFLKLEDANVGDISVLADLNELQNLRLDGTKVKDISPLKNLTELQYLFLVGTPVLDVTPLYDLRNLQGLSLYDTNVSDVNFNRLKSRLRTTNIVPPEGYVQIRECHDSDGGIEPFVFGYVNYDNGMVVGGMDYDDHCEISECTDDEFVREYYCDGDELASATIRCERGCVDGKCILENAYDVEAKEYEILTESPCS